jgi:hypothetical protein
VAVSGGVEVPIGDYIANLKNPGSGYEHHFAASNRSGMGVTEQCPFHRRPRSVQSLV